VSEAEPQRRLWINLGEGAAVLAVLISGLSYWDAHREHAVVERQALSQAQAQAAFVLTGTTENGGRQLALAPLKSTQAIQSQRYVFPAAVKADPVDVSAAQPRVEIDWIGSGLGRMLDDTHAGPGGESALPVAITTTYVEDGEMRTDRSLYRIGYAWQSRFLLGRHISLEGLSLIQRGITGDPKAVVDRQWAAGQHTAPGVE
jgi:hypothetical protein